MIAPVVDFDWLAGHDAVLADVRHYLDGRSGRAAYDAGHIPGAVYIELEDWLAAPATPQDGRHPLPGPEHFAAGMGEHGIGDDTTVVAYDDAGGAIAARLVWMLRALGRDAALLDGGLLAYDGPLETAAPRIAPAHFTPAPWPADRIASPDDAADPANVVIDARQRERFRGDTEPVDPRAGHIPGARSLPCREHLDERGRLLSLERLRATLQAAGIEEDTPVVSYCGSGVTACHNLLVLEHAGLGTGRLYPGSWSQWSHSSRPAATGDEPAGRPRSQRA
ncbi:sulfurtransferase [Candidatus Solirubrobacter pratensis]|uniref:sulfurtransferase n=1 Tax=Candidatus Solirubrobacter pratensis TaxID=1298857 RepID=UPI0004862E90|nr:sulfurtransferase [Candidatus Solirubrobacter pratensis]